MSHGTDFFIKEGDTSPDLQVTLKDGDGNAVDVSGAAIVFSMSAGGVVKTSEQTVTLVTASSGVVKYPWVAGDTDTPGTFIGEFEVTFAGGAIQTYPNSATGRLNIFIEPEIA